MIQVYYTLDGIPQSKEFGHFHILEDHIRGLCVRKHLKEFYVFSDDKWRFKAFYWNSKKGMWCNRPHVSITKEQVPGIYKTLQMIGA